jgi:hypothetical protein
LRLGSISIYRRRRRDQGFTIGSDTVERMNQPNVDGGQPHARGPRHLTTGDQRRSFGSLPTVGVRRLRPTFRK